jgi:hypothetical protein
MGSGDVRIVVRRVERGRFVRIHGFIQVLMPFRLLEFHDSAYASRWSSVDPVSFHALSLCCLELTNAHAVPHDICRRFLALHVHEPMSFERTTVDGWAQDTGVARRMWTVFSVGGWWPMGLEYRRVSARTLSYSICVWFLALGNWWPMSL